MTHTLIILYLSVSGFILSMRRHLYLTKHLTDFIICKSVRDVCYSLTLHSVLLFSWPCLAARRADEERKREM